MKVLALHQPWASLIAIGAKKVETRGWPAEKYGLVGERVAVQATKTGIPKYEFEELFDGSPYFAAALRPIFDPECQFSDRDLPGVLWKTLPRGVILATAVVDRSEQMGPLLIQRQSRAEWSFGDWQIGRYAFFLRGVEELPEPIPFSGHQGVPVWETECSSGYCAWDPVEGEPHTCPERKGII
jgi:hypothetical protein